MRIPELGRPIFAATLIALGLSGLIEGDFAAIWQPVSKALPGREVLVWAANLITLATGAALIWRRSAVLAARILVAWLLLWLLVAKGRVVIQAPAAAVSWESAGETAVLLAAAGVLHARLARGFATGAAGLRAARVVYGLALVAFGIAHFAYVKETASLVPPWLPAPNAWVWLTGATYVAAGLAVSSGVLARLAATLSAVQIGLFTLLVWVPVVTVGGADAGQWSETALSWALTAGAWVVAESYRGTPWRAFYLVQR